MSLLLLMVPAVIGGLSILYPLHWVFAALDQAFAMLFYASVVGLAVWSYLVEAEAGGRGNGRTLCVCPPLAEILIGRLGPVRWRPWPTRFTITRVGALEVRNGCALRRRIARADVSPTKAAGTVSVERSGWGRTRHVPAATWL